MYTEFHFSFFTWTETGLRSHSMTPYRRAGPADGLPIAIIKTWGKDTNRGPNNPTVTINFKKGQWFYRWNVTYQTLFNYSRPERVWLVTSRLGDGKIDNLFLQCTQLSVCTVDFDVPMKFSVLVWNSKVSQIFCVRDTKNWPRSRFYTVKTIRLKLPVVGNRLASRWYTSCGPKHPFTVLVPHP